MRSLKPIVIKYKLYYDYTYVILYMYDIRLYCIILFERAFKRTAYGAY